MHEAVLEDRFLEHAGALGLAQQRHQLRLHVGGEPRIGRGGEVGRLQCAVSLHVHAIGIPRHFAADGLQGVDRRHHLVSARAFEPHFAPGDRRRAGIGARLDPVRHDAVGRAVQALDPVDGERGGADAFDLRAHGDKHVAQIDNLGLARGVEQAAGAVCQHGRHQRILGRADADHREVEIAARHPAIGLRGLHVARRELDMRAESFQRLQVQVDRAVADRAAAGHRDGRLAAARQHRAEHQDRGAHLAHQIIGRDIRGDPRRLHAHHPSEILRARPLNDRRDAELVHQVLEPVNISEARQVAQGQRLLGEQRAGNERERGILGPRNGDRAGKAVAAANDEFVHPDSLREKCFWRNIARLAANSAIDERRWARHGKRKAEPSKANRIERRI